ncbi:enoyl-CoA hydratase/isomerase family protein [Aestuariirhabdus litorea]|uniref:Enoyl-CoA hydratase/isomerase family protein n=1 Tax=Aestuariirhabdus litorea TaxID=2528527 RepID=A0A3P3VQ09_9GAMM|nr:enoyl-CoA hydratase/isomerase family protein [Aestuariirhabdus litorea]RRJ83756.1 enoyl-CoA hydratase/isomerase family protein [Aestuariirhabdus litorea]RWW96979.1 enoyl-CoA hydratase/isomerase family protein [Endozoicomonadaceae bacterium GTF-13]
MSSNPTSCTAVTCSIDERGVATVTLNNPDKHNAFDDAMIAALSDHFHTLAQDNGVRVVVLASCGRSFSAGADLNWMKRMASYSFEENLRDANALANMLQTLNTLPKPTIARVQGAAFGGAVGLVSCCDMAVASSRASFCLSEVRIGLVPATISPYVINAIGQRAARRYFTTAERFSAQRAQTLGLVSEVVDEEELDTELERLLTQLLGNGPRAVALAKELLFDVSGRPIDDEVIADTCERIASIRVSEEGQAGLGAFLDKQSPPWIKE